MALSRTRGGFLFCRVSCACHRSAAPTLFGLFTKTTAAAGLCAPTPGCTLQRLANRSIVSKRVMSYTRAGTTYHQQTALVAAHTATTPSHPHPYTPLSRRASSPSFVSFWVPASSILWSWGKPRVWPAQHMRSPRSRRAAACSQHSTRPTVLASGCPSLLCGFGIEGWAALWGVSGVLSVFVGPWCWWSHLVLLDAFKHEKLPRIITIKQLLSPFTDRAFVMWVDVWRCCVTKPPLVNRANSACVLFWNKGEMTVVGALGSVAPGDVWQAMRPVPTAQQG